MAARGGQLDPNDAKLLAAAATGDHVSLRMYAEIGGQINAKDPMDSERTAVHKAAAGGHDMCLRWLVGLQAEEVTHHRCIEPVLLGLWPVALKARANLIMHQEPQL